MAYIYQLGHLGSLFGISFGLCYSSFFQYRLQLKLYFTIAYLRFLKKYQKMMGRMLELCLTLLQILFGYYFLKYLNPFLESGMFYFNTLKFNRNHLNFLTQILFSTKEAFRIIHYHHLLNLNLRIYFSYEMFLYMKKTMGIQYQALQSLK